MKNGGACAEGSRIKPKWLKTACKNQKNRKKGFFTIKLIPKSQKVALKVLHFPFLCDIIG
jgi:hypothetical protein